jgi:hypothetical protein
MTATVNFATVTASIAALSIAGVTIKNTDEIADAIALGTSVLAPRPRDFVTDFNVEVEEFSKQNLNLSYTLHYMYYHCRTGTNALFASYAPMIDKLALIILALCSDVSLSGAMDNGVPHIGTIAAIEDGSGNYYHCCEVSIDIIQFLEV